MIERFLLLRTYLEMMVLQGSLPRDYMLSAGDVIELKDMANILRPFMVAQKAMEGQKYVTISLLPYLISEMRLGLITAKEEANSNTIQSLTEKMIKDSTNGFNTYWGDGEDGTVFTENATLG